MRKEKIFLRRPKVYQDTSTSATQDASVPLMSGGDAGTTGTTAQPQSEDYEEMIDLYEQCIVLARTAAKPRGYAITFHGTGQRDLDLVAIPWTEQACSMEDLVRDIADQIQCGTGKGVLVEGVPIYDQKWPKPTLKPHGRVAYSILLGGAFYIDLSVMPRISEGQNGEPSRRSAVVSRKE